MTMRLMKTGIIAVVLSTTASCGDKNHPAGEILSNVVDGVERILMD